MFASKLDNKLHLNSLDIIVCANTQYNIDIPHYNNSQKNNRQYFVPKKVEYASVAGQFFQKLRMNEI